MITIRQRTVIDDVDRPGRLPLVPQTRPRPSTAGSTPGDTRQGIAQTAHRPPERLRHRIDFQRTLRRGRRVRHPLLHLAAHRTGNTATRVGFSVSKRVGNAVTRNRVKRRLRMIVRALPWRDGIDIVILAQSPAASATYDELEQAFEVLARRIELLAEENA